MKLPAPLDAWWERFHAKAPKPPARLATTPDALSITVLGSSALLLTLFAYYGRTNHFRGSALHEEVVAWLGPAGVEYSALLPYVWWGLMAIVIRIVTPLLILRPFGLKARDLGLGRGQGGAGIYLAAYLVMLPFLFWAATHQGFINKYPLYEGAQAGGTHFWIFQASYALQFAGVEFFFRGFLLFALFRRIGWYALWVSMIPYVMIHFGKPIEETLGAIIAGLVLGYLALRSRTIWYGVALHAAIGFTMDILALRARGLSLGEIFRGVGG